MKPRKAEVVKIDSKHFRVERDGGLPVRVTPLVKFSPLSYPSKRLLTAIEENPGFSRAELAVLLYPEMPPHYSGRKVCKMVKALERRRLVEFDVIHEGGRAGVPGVYMVGKKRPEKPGYLGVFGWVSE